MVTSVKTTLFWDFASLKNRKVEHCSQVLDQIVDQQCAHSVAQMALRVLLSHILDCQLLIRHLLFLFQGLNGMIDGILISVF